MSSRYLTCLLGAALLASGGAATGVASPPATAPRAVTAATPHWLPATVLARSSYAFDIATDGRGAATIVWSTKTGEVHAVRRAPDGTWGRSVFLGDGDYPQVVADARGTMTAVWLRHQAGFTPKVVAARRPAGKGWSTPVALSADLARADGAGARRVAVAAGAGGAVVVAWEWAVADEPLHVQAVYRSARKEWGKPVLVGNTALRAANPKPMVDRAGTVTLVYRAGGDNPSVKSVRRVAGAGWSDPELVVARPVEVSLAGNARGDVVVLFFAPKAVVQAVRRPTGSGWSAVEDVSPTKPGGQNLLATMTAAGGIRVGWDLPNGRVVLVERPPTGSWSTPATVVTDRVGDMELAGNPRGDLFVAWGSYAVRGRYRPAAGAFGPVATIQRDPGVDVLEFLDVAVTTTGDVLVVWKQEARPLRVRVGDVP